jgi:transcriptional regulator, propionate catabolism operon regulatory protein
MLPRICVVGYAPVIAFAQEIAQDFKDAAEFVFVTSLLEGALPRLREVEGTVDIIVAGPSTRRMYEQDLKVPIIDFRLTFPDLIRAIQEARRIDRRIALCHSRGDRDVDLTLLEEVMEVAVTPYACDTSAEYAAACRTAQEAGFQVILGGSFTVQTAESLGMRGILVYKGSDVLRRAVERAVEICRIHREQTRRVSQLAAVVEHVPDGLLLTDEQGRVMLANGLAERRLGARSLVGRRASELFGSRTASEVLRRGRTLLHAIERGNLVVNYVPVQSGAGGAGLVCTFKEVGALQDAELTARRELHGRGFVAKYRLDDIVGSSRAIQNARERAALFAAAAGPILITGESGTGKELFAHGIHAASPRRRGPFVAINCATLPAELLESELFGYVRGAFTGARAAGKQGLIELAHTGTLFLDEITSLGYPLQAKLLRLLAEGEILKLGSDRVIPVDIRIVAATNERIEACVAERRFRGDLYYRLAAFRLHLPPLRERPEDLVPLFLYCAARIRPDVAAHFRKARACSALHDGLVKAPFPGNVRELDNVAQRFCLLWNPELSGAAQRRLLEECLEVTAESAAPAEDLKQAVQRTEAAMLRELTGAYRSRQEVARALGVDRSTLWRKLRKYRIDAAESRSRDA